MKGKEQKENFLFFALNNFCQTISAHLIMPYYIAAYDVEAIYPWWELGDQKYSADLYQQSVSYIGKHLKECLDGIASVAEIHKSKNLPATFFLVVKLVENAAAELRPTSPA